MRYSRLILCSAFSLCVLATQSSYAVECPSATTIINQLAAVEPQPMTMQEGNYFVVWKLNFKNKEWMFYIENIEAKNLFEATLKAHDALISLSGKPTLEQTSHWKSCTYHVEYEGYKASAVLS